MKKNVMLFALAASALATTSCNKSDSETVEDAKYITVNTSISSLSGTTTDDKGVQSFADKDKISVYVWTGNAGAVNADEMVVNNSINTLSVSETGNTWAAEPQMLWKDMSSGHYFLGVYPSKDITDFTAEAYTLDLTKTEEQNDLLVAVNTGIDQAGLTATTSAVPLQFDHVLAKLIVNLTFRNQWGGTPTVENVTTTNLRSKATVDYLAKCVTATADEATPIVLPATAANTSYQSVMVPQTGEAATITIRIDGKDYIYTGKVALESGKYTTVNLTVGRDKIELGTISINDWGEGNKGSGGTAIE